MNIWGVFRCVEKHFVIHYEQCQNRKQSRWLLTAGIDCFDFDRAKLDLRRI